MSVTIKRQISPNLKELRNFFERVFAVYNPEDVKNFTDESNPTLDEWIAIDELPRFLKEGFLLEARSENGKLVGAVFAAKNHSLNWPDGKKMEVFILGIDPDTRGVGLGKQLMVETIKEARIFGAKKLVLNTHHSLLSVHHFYESLGFEKIGVMNDFYADGNAVFFMKKL